MRLFEQAVSRLGIVGEVFAFLYRRRLWWLVPMVGLLFLFIAVLLLAQATGIAPFIYTLF